MENEDKIGELIHTVTSIKEADVRRVYVIKILKAFGELLNTKKMFLVGLDGDKGEFDFIGSNLDEETIHRIISILNVLKKAILDFEKSFYGNC